MAEYSKLKKHMKDLILSSGCYNPSTQWINLDHLWHLSDRMNEFSDYLAAYLDLLSEELDFDFIILTDKLFGPFGSLPLFIIASLKCKNKHPFVIWKEWATPSTGDSKTFGHLKSNSNAMICHDVTDYGTTILKVVKDIYRIDPSIAISGVLSICSTERNGVSLIEDYVGITPKHILSLSELNE